MLLLEVAPLGALDEGDVLDAPDFDVSEPLIEALPETDPLGDVELLDGVVLLEELLLGVLDDVSALVLLEVLLGGVVAVVLLGVLVVLVLVLLRSQPVAAAAARARTAMAGISFFMTSPVSRCKSWMNPSMGSVGRARRALRSAIRRRCTTCASPLRAQSEGSWG